MTYTIIEDCSPFYIRFTFPGIEEIVKFVKENLEHATIVERATSYQHTTFELKYGYQILSKLPMYRPGMWRERRVSIFSTEPGSGSGIHKDGNDTRVSFNIPITVLDDKCVTSWYSDDVQPSAGDRETSQYGRVACVWNKTGFDHIPKLKELVAKPNEMILFNTDIYHSWDNRNSSNIRQILTLRLVEQGTVYFEDARKALFGY